MNKVLLIYPQTSGQYPDDLPILTLSLPVLSTTLQSKGIACKMHFEDITKIEPGNLSSLLYDVDIIGISCMYVQVPRLITLAKMIKSVAPMIKLIVGGPQATIAADELMGQIPEIDYCVIGEAEDTFPELVCALRNGRKLKDIKGICLRQNDRVVRTTKRPLIADLDTLPIPDFASLPYEKLVRYDSVQGETNPHGRLAIPIETSRGCPFKCIFCSANKIKGSYCRLKTPKRIVHEIEQAMRSADDLRPCNFVFRFIDDNFLINERRVRNFCELLIERGKGIEWSCNCRGDIRDVNLLKMMRDAGCRRVFVGAEVGYQQGLDRIGKGTTIKGVFDFVRLATQQRIIVTCGWIIGLPWENTKEISATIGAALAICCLAPDIIRSPVYIATPFPGTALSEQVEVTHWHNDLFSMTLPFKHSFLTDDDVKFYLFLSRIGQWLIWLLHGLSKLLDNGEDISDFIETVRVFLPRIMEAEPPYYWNNIIREDKRLNFLLPLENPPQRVRELHQLLKGKKGAIFELLDIKEGKWSKKQILV